MLFDNELDINMLNTIMGLNKDTNSKLSNDKVGLQRGNMFNNEYKPYKNLNPKSIIASTEKDELCLKLFECNFAIIDLNLYLDLHPENKDLYELYKDYVKKYEEYKNNYEQKYGSLDITDIKTNYYNWIKNPWPWDKNGGIKYV